MSIEKKLASWQEAGLIDAATRERIDAFERGRERPVLLYALGGLGALTIGIGIVSVVAANWDGIGKAVKLAADLGLGALIAAGLYVAVRRGHAWQSDVLAGVYYAYVIASIALLGQVYQLGAPTYQALLTWSLATVGFMWLVRSRVLGFVWLSGLLWTQSECIAAWFEIISKRSGHDDALIAGLAATLAFASALAYLMLARLPWLARERPQVSSVWNDAVWSLILLGSFGSCFVFYEHSFHEQLAAWSVASCAVIAFVLCALLPRLYRGLNTRAHAGACTLIGSAWLVLATGATFQHGRSELLGALAQLAILATAAWTVLALGRVRVFNLLTALIALRILVIYFEVFGSMLNTGLGMITGGVLTLFFAWIWKRKSPELALRLAAKEPSHVA